jgi:hypothetical protein
LRKIVSRQGKSMRYMEITYSTLVGIHLNESSSERYDPSVFIVLADKIVPEGQGAKGVRVEFCPSEGIVERYVLETRTEIMQVLPVQKSITGKIMPKWELVDPKDDVFKVKGMYLGFIDIAGLFENEKKEFKPYFEFMRNYCLSWNKKNVFGTVSELELRFEIEPEK